MLIDKYKKLSNGVKASIWFIVCSIIQKSISFITIPLFTRIMTASEYGEYSLFLAWQEIITIFATLNLNYQTFNNGMIKYKNDKDGYTISMVGLGLISCLFVYAFISMFYPFWYKYTSINFLSLSLMFINMFCLLIFGLWTVRNRYDYKYKLLTILTILMAFLNPFLGFFLVKNSSNKVLLRIVSIVITSLIFGFICFVLMLKKSQTLYKKEYWKYALSLSLPLIPHYISMVILNSSDRIMIGNIVGEEFTAFYSISYSVAVIVQVVLNAINASFIPFVYKNMEDKNYNNINKYSVPIIAFVAIICLFPMFFAPEVVYILGGKQYYDAVTIVPMLSLSVFMIYVYSIFIIIEMYFEKNKFITLGSFCAAVLNIILNVIFINIFGYKAAAYTTLISYMALAFFHYILFKKILKDNNIRNDIFNVRIIFFLSIVLLILSIFILFIYNYTFIRYLILILLLILLFLFRKKIFKIYILIKNKDN